MSATSVQHPITDHLWQLGFNLESKAERMPAPIVAEDEAFYTTFAVTAYPERGEARRLFAAKGPAEAEVKSNLVLEVFLSEQEQGIARLKDLYTEKCAAVLLDMLKAAAPTLTMPRTEAPA
jgi:hypothetical protein